ncbi:MAG: hypothetical protein DMF70_08310 [Acidobacteria bacterium]|nr:MAG: hypothetical protein DMF70_08310 [Acidobacteriota bacterium]
MSEARIANEFKRIVGAINVNRLVETDLAAKFQTNTAETERALSIAPATAGEAREALKLAAREGLALIPAGAANWLDVGNPLSRVDLILSTHRMTKIIRHEPADLVATAEAGTTLVEFQKQLASAGQWLPIDPPDDPSNDRRATLGRKPSAMACPARSLSACVLCSPMAGRSKPEVTWSRTLPVTISANSSAEATARSA